MEDLHICCRCRYCKFIRTKFGFECESLQLNTKSYIGPKMGDPCKRDSLMGTENIVKDFVKDQISDMNLNIDFDNHQEQGDRKSGNLVVNQIHDVNDTPDMKTQLPDTSKNLSETEESVVLDFDLGLVGINGFPVDNKVLEVHPGVDGSSLEVVEIVPSVSENPNQSKGGLDKHDLVEKGHYFANLGENKNDAKIESQKISKFDVVREVNQGSDSCGELTSLNVEGEEFLPFKFDTTVKVKVRPKGSPLLKGQTKINVCAKGNSVGPPRVRKGYCSISHAKELVDIVSDAIPKGECDSRQKAFRREIARFQQESACVDGGVSDASTPRGGDVMPLHGQTARCMSMFALI